MVLSIIIILLIGLIAFFHYTQGFFSATISAMITVMAALIAVSYHETVVNMLLKGKMADVSNSFVLCLLFAATYFVLRFIFDMAVPGNVRTPSGVDKAGSVIMGIISGIFLTGIFALAVQMLPFGPTISFLGYSRYPTKDTRNVIVPSAENRQNLDAEVHDELIDPVITGEPDSIAKQKGLIIPVDDLLLDTVYHVSAENGSLAGARTLASVHPDYLQELFGERLGQQDGERRSALVVPGNESITLGGVFAAASLPAADAVVKEYRQEPKVPAEIKSDREHQILIVRVTVHSNATDDADGIFRFSTGSIRLVSQGKDYYPIGTLENAQTVLLNHADDFLFLNLKGGDGTFGAVFQVDSNVLVGAGKTTNAIADGTFVAVKRFGLLNLSGQTIGDSIPPISNGPIRSIVLLSRLALPPAPIAVKAAPVQATAAPVAPTPAAPAAPPETPNEPAKPAVTASATVSSTLSFPIGCKTDNNDDPNVTVAGGTVALKAGNIAIAQIDPVDLTDLAKGDSQLKELAVPDGYKLVQVSYSTSGDPYAWVAQNGAIQVTDSNSNPYKANGVIVRLNQGSEKAMVRYDMNHTQFAVPAINGGTPQSTTFLFLIRTGTHLTNLRIGDETTPINVDVPQ